MQSVSDAFKLAVVDPVRRIAQRVKITFLNSGMATGLTATASEGDATACPKEALIDGREGIWGSVDTVKRYAWPDYYDETGAGSGETIFEDDFETGDMSGWDESDNVTVQSTVKHGGTYAAEFDYDGVNECYMVKTIASQTAVEDELYVYLVSFPSLYEIVFYSLRNSTEEYGIRIYLSTDGYVTARLVSDADDAQQSTPSALSLDAWHKIKYSLNATSSSSWTLEWSVDDVAQTAISISTTIAGDLTQYLFATGGNEQTLHYYLDDITI